MTREEAIEWLTDIKENITENWSHDVAIDMAIEALQGGDADMTGTSPYMQPSPDSGADMRKGEK